MPAQVLYNPVSIIHSSVLSSLPLFAHVTKQKRTLPVKCLAPELTAFEVLLACGSSSSESYKMASVVTVRTARNKRLLSLHNLTIPRIIALCCTSRNIVGRQSRLPGAVPVTRLASQSSHATRQHAGHTPRTLTATRL
jgi:hypothetical protein